MTGDGAAPARALTRRPRPPADAAAGSGETASREAQPLLVALPAPRLTGGASLEGCLATRRSIRSFEASPLAPSEIGQLLWACQGVTAAGGLRTAPSAGALFPLTIYVADASGVSRYWPGRHAVSAAGADDVRARLREAALDQDAMRAPSVFVIAADMQLTARKYGARARQYVTQEVGHAAQNLLLQAVALGLGAVPIGAFDEEQARRALGLPRGVSVLLLIPVGRPASAANGNDDPDAEARNR